MMSNSMTIDGMAATAAWNAFTLDPRWCRRLERADIEALQRGLARFRDHSPELDLSSMTDENFPLPELDGLVESLRHRLIDGQGVAAFEGFPVEDHDLAELRAIWWGLSRAIGRPVAQSHRGDLIGDVRDLGTGISGRAGRGYTSSSELNFHTDAADVSGLFFLRTARSGGVTRIASAVTTHDVIAARRPDLLAELYQPLSWSWQGNERPEEQPWYEQPVFGRVDDEVSCAFVRTNIVDAQRNAGAPELTDAQLEAVDFVVQVASEPGMWVERQFAPGAMLFVHNHTVLHLRSAFTDWDEPERRRHLLRVWLSTANSRALPATFAPFFGDIENGAVRGGYPSRVDQPVFETV